MRILLRLIILWLVILPITLYFTMPMILKEMSRRTAEQTYTQCLAQTAAQPDNFTPATAQSYCGCLRDGVSLTRNDLFALLRKQPPAELNQRLQAQVTTCTDRLQHPADGDAQTIHF